MRRWWLSMLVVLCVLAPVRPAAADGTWLWPVVGPITRGFDPPDSPYGSGHRGIDIATDAGTIVLAPASGTVKFAGPIGGVPVLDDRSRQRSRLDVFVGVGTVGTQGRRRDGRRTDHSFRERASGRLDPQPALRGEAERHLRGSLALPAGAKRDVVHPVSATPARIRLERGVSGASVADA